MTQIPVRPIRYDWPPLRWVPIPHSIIDDHRLDADCLRILCTLARFAYDPEQAIVAMDVEDIRAFTRLEGETVEACVKRLVALGLLEAEVTLPGDHVVYALASLGEDAP